MTDNTNPQATPAQVEAVSLTHRHIGCEVTFEIEERAEVADVRSDTFAEVSHAMNLVADIWERDGSDPCRVRITREYANAYRLYAEGLGEPTGSAKFRAALAEPTPDPTESSSKRNPCPRCGHDHRLERWLHCVCSCQWTEPTPEATEGGEDRG